MPIYMNIDSLASQISTQGYRGGINVAMGDGSVRFANDLQDIAAAVKRSHPGGVNAIFIGQSNQAGWSAVTSFQTKGIIAILIGLLLPAIQKVREAASRSPNADALTKVGLGTLQMSLVPGCKLSVVNGDGKLLPYI